ncbi:hypothetical protein [Anabaena sp. CCY 0017]|uniref:hypothetical protein n=1 Tax=Anabaena sp. CCY 0017 TaxID=3103866 RepID=UPI0039C6021A
MNYVERLAILLDLYRLEPSDKFYQEIENLMISYQSNPPDAVRKNMENISSESMQEIRKHPNWMKPEPLTDAFSHFINCPTNKTFEILKLKMQEYKTHFNTNN